MVRVFTLMTVTVVVLGCCGCVGTSTSSHATAAPAFGHGMLEHFQLQEGFLNLNHGSFGATPKSVRAYQEQLTTQMEARPDDWFRGGYQRLLDATRAQLAAYVSANADDVVFVENASSGVNAVLRSFPLTANDTVAFLSCAYPMVTNTAEVLGRAGRARVRKIPVQFPVKSAEEVVQLLDNALRQQPNSIPTILSISHIVSTPAVILPIVEMTKVAKAHGVKHVLIDGAHALGNIPINITQLAAVGVDFYVSNGHKWLYTPKGSAFLWTRPSLQRNTIPTVVSSDFGFHDYMRDFLYTGTRDYTPFASVTAGFAFRKNIGGDAAVREYMTNLARWATDYLVGRWGTEAAAPHSMVSAMATVRLPTTDAALAQGLTPWLIENHDVQIVVFRMTRNPDCTCGTATAGTAGAGRGSRGDVRGGAGSDGDAAVIACDRWINPDHLGSTVSFLTGYGGGSSSSAQEDGNAGNQDGCSADPDQDTWWVRLSAQVYIEQADFVRLADLVDAYLAQQL
ncbi:hypothetical protein PTSG_01513 [Salpingoeca rosetta]|uniref:Aminotransferase class V domain-containing protein n=1 Tax=Salpingoeca rosetta (strain ATCC 50818 / BSB-021) TaxID=946362 RepID=F2U0K2_SALR5|nr:uncharacterized protein PTSG_01513 [Salpingoeca rosetta]EGD80930.1 hypothetical protein PTSG_01513 [Salpingoeca rosetta]|eukprot:XP_004997491.1 hypothetical protein PTSG_01513 [Salpingoeca rosetta]